MINSEMIYLDNNSTTPVDPIVLDAMLPYFKQNFGNAASRSHSAGWIADEAVKIAREQMAGLIKCHPKEIIFSSGATESVNLALKGAYEAYQSGRNHIITFATEHKAVLDTCLYLQKLGAEVTILPVLENGRIDLEILRDAITPKTLMVCVMWANNETGVIQPMKEIGLICEEKEVLLMSDATQAVGKIPVDPHEMGVHLMTFSAHKMYGPKGTGGLFISMKPPRVKIKPIIHGGGHERDLRSGTLNVPGIVGLGKAAEMAAINMDEDAKRLSALRDHLEKSLIKELPEVIINGDLNHRLANVSNVHFKLVDAEALIATFNQKVAVSSGSACTSASVEPSHVLTAMGLTRAEAHSSIRFSLGKFNDSKEIEFAIRLVVEGVHTLRTQSPLWNMYKKLDNPS